MFDRVTLDPKIMGGRACIRGMRVPVSVIVNQIAHGASFDFWASSEWLSLDSHCGRRVGIRQAAVL